MKPIACRSLLLLATLTVYLDLEIAIVSKLLIGGYQSTMLQSHTSTPSRSLRPFFPSRVLSNPWRTKDENSPNVLQVIRPKIAA